MQLQSRHRWHDLRQVRVMGAPKKALALHLAPASATPATSDAAFAPSSSSSASWWSTLSTPEKGAIAVSGAAALYLGFLAVSSRKARRR